MPELWTQPLI